GVHEQASPLQLYDPSRGRMILRRGQPSSWAALLDALGLSPQPGPPAGMPGEGLAFLLEPTGSPLILALLDGIRARYPAARVYVQDGGAPGGALEGARLAYGRPLQAHYDFGSAATVVSLDSDFLSGTP